MVSYPDRPCPVCKRPMTGRQKTGCSGRCRAAVSRRNRQRKLLATLDEADRALRKVRLALLLDRKGEEWPKRIV